MARSVLGAYLLHWHWRSIGTARASHANALCINAVERQEEAIHAFRILGSTPANFHSRWPSANAARTARQISCSLKSLTRNRPLPGPTQSLICDFRRMIKPNVRPEACEASRLTIIKCQAQILTSLLLSCRGSVLEQLRGLRRLEQKFRISLAALLVVGCSSPALELR